MWCSVMRQAGEMGILQVHLSGGEPTARKDLEDIVEAFDYFFFNYQAAPLLVVKADDLDFGREDDIAVAKIFPGIRLPHDGTEG